MWEASAFRQSGLVIGITLLAMGTAHVAAVRRGRPPLFGSSSSFGLAFGMGVAIAVAGVNRLLSSPSRGHAAFLQHPRHYVARRGTPKVIDGDIEKDVWKAVPWSEPFVEIRGADAPEGTAPRADQSTRMKMLWDDDFLYIAAVMDVPAGEELVAKFTERNSPIFHTDSDFEVFVDPAGCCHSYKELEMNALNTVWNLMLNKPYSDGGGEHSGRVAKPSEPNHWDVQRQRTAARILSGSLSDPSQPSRWCCEVALSHSDNTAHLPVPAPSPKPGAAWRINFSRVEQKGKINWVWSPQVVWSPKDRRFAGQVNMHLPDAWGYVVFGDSSGSLPGDVDASSWADPMWPVRQATMCIYYAMRAYKEQHGQYPGAVADLERSGLLPADVMAGADVQLTMSNGHKKYVAVVTVARMQASVDQARLLRVLSSSAPVS